MLLVHTGPFLSYIWWQVCAGFPFIPSPLFSLVCYFGVRDQGAPSLVILGFPRAGQWDVLFPWKINCTNPVFLFSRLIWLDTEHSRPEFLAWQVGVRALQHFPAKNRCYFSPWLTLPAASRTACGQKGLCTHPAPPEWHLRGMRAASWMCAGLSQHARLRSLGGEMSLSIHFCFISKGQVVPEGLGFATLGPAKPKAGLGHHWSKDFCAQSNTAGLEL